MVKVYTPAARFVAVRVPVAAILPEPGVNVTPAGRSDADSHGVDFPNTGVSDVVVTTNVVVVPGIVMPVAADVKVGALVGATADERPEGELTPTALLAATVNV
jgi:hypothetical protein